MTPAAARCAVLLAHPGHELVIHGFVERSRPIVAVLTDGSGGRGEPRVASTTRVLENSGAEPSGFYGGFTDQQCYTALLNHDAGLFIAMAEKLADVLVDSRVETVVGDASEGWNPIHDIWRSVINTAVALASHRLDHSIRNFDFLLFGSHRTAADGCSREAIVLNLDDAAYERKLATSEMYAELHDEVQAAISGSTSSMVRSPQLSAELDRRLAGLNAAAYRTELLRPVLATPPSPATEPLVYELYGEMMVAAGRYKEAIRHERHLAPIEKALQQHAARETGSRLCASSSPITT
jgi:hypothetical protein